MEAVIAVGFVLVRTSKLMLPPLDGTYIVGAMAFRRLSYFASLTTPRMTQPGAAQSPFSGFASRSPKCRPRGFTFGKYFWTKVLLTITGTGASLAALSGTAAFPAGAGRPASFACCAACRAL